LEDPVYQRPNFSERKKFTAMKAIRAFCIDCYCGVKMGDESPTTCPDYDCPLWRFRMGMGPDNARRHGYDVSDLH